MTKAPCQGDHDKCTICKDGAVRVGILGAPNRKTGKRRVRGCNDPTGRGKRNRTKGKSKQRAARRAVGVGDSPVPAAFADEEAWPGIYRFEVKAGQQIKSMTTRFSQAEDQSNAARLDSDERDFMFVAMPDGWGDEGLICMRLSTFKRDIVPNLANVPPP